MQRTLIVLAVLAASTAYAQVSTVSNGSVVSYAASSGNGAFSASGMANNSASANAVGAGNLGSANAAVSAATSGATHTVAGGIGSGTALGQASQDGAASAERSGLQGVYLGPILLLKTGTANAQSQAQVGSYSNAGVVNLGTAHSTTNAAANNASSAGMTTSYLPPNYTSTGATSGESEFTTTAFKLFGGSAVANGTMTVGPVNNVGAFDKGSFSVTRP